MLHLRNITVCILLFFALNLHAQAQQRETFKIGPEQFELNGKPYIIRCGEMHFARIPKAEWRNRLKMAKAMGLNTVCAYLFWNMHEKEPGKFTWTGQSDAAAFCRLAKEEGLYVILRPGPYSCAEWEFGGFPWWLLKDKSIALRTQHPYFLERSKQYLAAVGKELAPLQLTHGGNILMVQVENEYGSFGNDKDYMNKIKSFVQAAGFDVPLFHCDGPSQLKNDHPDGLFAVVNFGSGPEQNFKALRAIQPEGPLMCGEYYPGWFDSWGRPHHKGDAKRIVSELKYMLDHKASFSIYMAHGGTSFGTYSGANAPPFLPQTTSYDYDAPIDEAGNATEKFYAIRELFGKYLQEGEKLPPVPARITSQTLAAPKFTAYAPLMKNLPKPVTADSAMLVEDLNQAFGSVLYETTVPAGGKAQLQFKDIHDYAVLYLNGKEFAVFDRRKNRFTAELPARTKPSVLRVLVEAVGRVNYGHQMHDRKGIHGAVMLSENGTQKELKNWKNYSLPMGDKTLPVKYIAKGASQTADAGFYKAAFTSEKPVNTYLDMRKWNKGLVWINGQCLGRYWKIGPTQTMLVPGSWLKKGQNEVVIYDVHGVEKPELAFLDKPILDEVNEAHPEKHRKAGQQWNAGNLKPLAEGAFPAGDDWQTVKFAPLKARYFCFEALSEQQGQPYTSVAELVLLDKNGKELPRTGWKVVYADSEELNGDDGDAANVFDLQFTSIWHTEWENRSPKPPHQIVIDLGAENEIAGMKMLPRQGNPNGRVKDYRVYLSAKPFPGL